MSVVAVKNYKDKIVMCSDSIVVSYGEHKTNNKDIVKLKRCNEMIIGGVGYCDELSLMFHYMENHKPLTASERDVLNFVVEFAKWKTDYNDGKTINNSYLMIYEGKIFHISGMLVNEVQEFSAIGAGYPFALTALHLGHTPKEAVKVSCELSCFVCEPILEEIYVK